MKLALVFPGQGSQKVGMGKALADAFAESRAAFDEVDAALAMPLSRLCFEGPEADLQLTANTQPAILATSIAAWRALAACLSWAAGGSQDAGARGVPSTRGIRPDFVAGHSLGEYSALVAAGTISLAEAAVAVRRRGQYMQEAVPVGIGAMAAILGLDLATIEAACRQAAQGQVVSPANINSPGQVVIAGHKDAVDRASALAKVAGAKRAVPLPVSAPFHCALMAPAQERLARDFASLIFRDPEVPLVNNVDALVIESGDDCREGLVRQVSSPVRWLEVVETLAREGVDTVVEVGPGTVLSGLVKKIDKSLRVWNVEDPASLEAALAALAEAR